jgi:WW domain-containing oxidoreductase
MSPRFGARSTCDDVVAGHDLRGKNVLVTGASSGIGYETARALASAGAHVVLACRNTASAQETARRIVAAHPTASLRPLAVDLASFASIRGAAQELGTIALHTLICNAGLYTERFATTQEGIESTVGVCHFGHALLFTLLRDALREAAQQGAAARVVMVSSESHRHPARLRFERFPLTQDHYRGLVAYGQAKLCNVLFANELTRRHASDGIYANSLHPGAFIGTSIFRNSLGGKLVALLGKPLTKSVPQGAATSVYCALAPELERVGGGYYADCRVKTMSRCATDADVAARLWELTAARLAEPARRAAG